jgi:hypothetical protein
MKQQERYFCSLFRDHILGLQNSKFSRVEFLLSFQRTVAVTKKMNRCEKGAGLIIRLVFKGLPQQNSWEISRPAITLVAVWCRCFEIVALFFRYLINGICFQFPNTFIQQQVNCCAATVRVGCIAFTALGQTSSTEFSKTDGPFLVHFHDRRFKFCLRIYYDLQ